MGAVSICIHEKSSARFSLKLGKAQSLLILRIRDNDILDMTRTAMLFFSTCSKINEESLVISNLKGRFEPTERLFNPLRINS